jgi:hypothetical protein
MLDIKTGIVALFLLTVVASPAQAAPPELRTLDRQVKAIDVAFTGDAEADIERLRVAVDTLRELKRAADDLPDELRPAGRVRVADAHLRLAEGLLDAPCPSELTGEQCDLYRGLLPGRAEPLVTAAGQVAALIGPDEELARSDRRRLEKLHAAIEVAASRIADATEAMGGVEGDAADHRAAPSPPVAPAEGWTPPPAMGGDDARFALVWGNAELRRFPDDPQPLRAYEYPDAERREHPGAVYLIEVLDGGGDGLVEARLGGGVTWERHCVGSNLLERWTAVRVWVEPGDLVEVLAEELAVDHEDGTGIRLMAGTPLIGDRAWVDGQLIPVPDGAVRAQHYPADTQRLQPSYSSNGLVWGTGGTVGGQPFALRQPAYDHNHETYLSSSRPVDGGVLVTLTRRCGEIRFLTGSLPPEDTAAGIFGLLGGAMGEDRVTLAAGTRLHWLDGRPAGQVAEERVLEGGLLYGEEMRCVDVELATTHDALAPRPVPLCVRPEDAAVSPAP